MIRGLTSAEVQERVSRGQVNGEEQKSENTYLSILVRNAATPFNLLLFILGFALVLLSDYVNAFAATGIIIFNILISTAQESRAKRRLDKIAVLLRPTVTVIRDDKEVVIDRADIVVDDVIHLQTGDQAQVDGEVIECRSVEMDEALLTGESSTVKKNPGDVILSGSSCVAGDCYFRATKVGNETFSSKMTSAARKFEKKGTPLQKETNAATEAMMIVAFVFLPISIVSQVIHNWGNLGDFVGDAVKNAVIILDIVPIALFLLITIMYMVSAVRMADSGVLLQNSGSVESMSHVDTVCMDKTGTITTNKLVFDDVIYVDPERSDYADTTIRQFTFSTGSRNRTLRAVEERFGSAECRLLDETQFSSARKYSAVRVETPDGVRTIVMGAWNVLSQKSPCNETVEGAVNTLSNRGLRTIVFCDAGDAELHNSSEDVIPPLTPLAVVSIRDEVREDCRGILHEFSKAGIDIKVISGDNPDTVEALFALANIPGERKRVSGDDLDNMDSEAFDKACLESNIFGRMRPEQKEEVVDSLRRSGRYVAMVGDGVNDVRSIKRANVGIAMESGAGAARGVADMILAGDDFKTLPRAITEGKKTVSGMRDILRLYLTRNVVLAGMVFILLIVFGTTPFTPIQNMAYALVTVTLPALLLTFIAKPSDDQTLVLPGIIRYGAPVSVTTVVGSLLVYLSTYYAIRWGFLDANQIVQTMVDQLNNAPDFVQNLMNWKTMYGTPESMIDHLTSGNPDNLALKIGLGSTFVFLMISGCFHLLFLFPPVKALSWDHGSYGRSYIPLVLMVLMLLLVLTMYFVVPWFATCFLTLVTPCYTVWMFIAVALAAWYVCTLFILRSKKLSWLEQWSVGLSKSILRDKSDPIVHIKQAVSAADKMFKKKL